jgi:hypothetical protein
MLEGREELAAGPRNCNCRSGIPSGLYQEVFNALGVERAYA